MNNTQWQLGTSAYPQQMFSGNYQNPANTIQYQQMQQPQQQFRSYIPGRPVNSASEVKAFEVPMDFPVSIFPKQDLSEIYIKYWGEDGTIKNKVFVEKVEETSECTSENNDILIRLDRIEKMLRKSKYRKPYTGNKQEG